MQKSTTIIGVLEMIEDGYSYRDIRARHCVGHGTISLILTKYKDLDISLGSLSQMNAEKIESLFYGNSHSRKDIPLPDFKEIYSVLSDRKRKSNLYFLWMEYKKKYPEGYQYTQFKEHFKRWLNKNNLEDELEMLVERVPGEIVYIDWAGDTLPLVLDSETGELREAHFFITTVGVSSYAFAMAFPNEKTECFVQGTLSAFEFYGAVPKILKPDNTKAAVIKNDKNSLVLNKVYEDIQQFYNVVIVPAPPLKPTGKSSVENGVRYIETHLLERLRGRWFQSFEDLNKEITFIMEEINSGDKKRRNRKEMFEKYDKAEMKPLPHDSFTLYTYIVKTVPSNYHLEYDGHLYSVPYFYYKQEVTLKVSFKEIKICDSMNRLICTHERVYKPFPKYITMKEHMASSHQYYYIENSYDAQAYKDWASKIGEPMYLLICRVIASFQYDEQSYKSCNGILHMCKDVPKTYANAAAQECIDYHICNYSHFKKVLNRIKNQKSISSNEMPEHKNIRGKENYK